jgi:hypothetical protein
VIDHHLIVRVVSGGNKKVGTLYTAKASSPGSIHSKCFGKYSFASYIVVKFLEWSSIPLLKFCPDFYFG